MGQYAQLALGIVGLQEHAARRRLDGFEETTGDTLEVRAFATEAACGGPQRIEVGVNEAGGLGMVEEGFGGVPDGLVFRVLQYGFDRGMTVCQRFQGCDRG